jgi:hypothetical protein
MRAQREPSRIFFLVGCGRSGTTSLARILNEAKNGICLNEPLPNLTWETRKLSEGRLPDPHQVILRTLVPRVAETLDRGLVYGEKNLTFAPFIPFLYDFLRCRLIYVRRDGRDVVTSWINWHNQLYGTVYRECKDPGALSDRAVDWLSSVPLEEDHYDYSRPRPAPDDDWYDCWEDLSRLEMLAWYWSRTNDLMLDRFAEIPSKAWMTVDYTTVTARDVLAACTFLGLEGLSKAKIQDMLDARLNSLEDRVKESGRFPYWAHWRPVDRVRFDAIALRTMQRLGYYPAGETLRVRPPAYERAWDLNGGRKDREDRAPSNDLRALLSRLRAEGVAIETVAEAGCGLDAEVADELAGLRYCGVDVNPERVTLRRELDRHASHAYVCADFVSTPGAPRADLVFSRGVIDRVYDVDAFLRAMVRRSRGWIFATVDGAWRPDLKDHRHRWDESRGRFANDFSPEAARAQLATLGCKDIDVTPLGANGRQGRILARIG